VTRRWTAAALTAAAVAVSSLGAQPAAQAQPALTSHGVISSATAGFLGCLHSGGNSAMVGCVVALRQDDGSVAVHVLGSAGPLNPAVPGVNATDFEAAVLPADALSVGGNRGYPTVRLHVPDGALARTGAIELHARAGPAPDVMADSQQCGSGTYPLAFALASDGAERDIAAAAVDGLWNGQAVYTDAYDDPCWAGPGALFVGPTSGVWAYAGADTASVESSSP
jgi:hypothetical protein